MPMPIPVHVVHLAQVSALVYWSNPRDSGVVCGSLLVCLLAVRYISLIRSARHPTIALF